MTFHQTIMRSTISAMMKKLLADVRKDPRRGIRKGLDLTSHFTSDQNQVNFFRWLSDILNDPEHPYSRLLQRKLDTLSDEAVTALAVNLGYTAFHTGAEQLQEEQKKNGSCPLWLSSPGSARELGAPAVENNKSRGVYSYLLSDGPVLGVTASLAEANPECTFFTVISALSEAGIRALKENLNMLAVVQLNEASHPQELFHALQDAGLVYGFYTTELTDHSLLSELIEAGCCFGLVSAGEAVRFADQPILLFDPEKDAEELQHLLLKA